MTKILIPTCRTREALEPMLHEIRVNTPDAHLVFASCCEGASASVNRNICLDVLSVGERAIMVDDDIAGFYPGWDDDLLKGLEIPNAVMVSARLLDKRGNFGPTCSREMRPYPEEIQLHWTRSHCIMPTAAMAFVHTGVRFDPAYLGSGWEDNDYMRAVAAANPSGTFWQSNRCRLIHLNEMKGQKGENWRHNQEYFNQKWAKIEERATA